MTGCKAACPNCGLDIWWQSQAELRQHIKGCEAIALGLLEAQVSPPVDGKPPDYGWV